MKNLTLILLLSTIALSSTSCKKEYTCTCILTVGGVAAGTSVNKIRAKKSNAASECDKNEYNVSSFGITSKSECDI